MFKKSKNIYLIMGMLSLSLVNGCAQKSQENDKSFYLNKLAPVNAITQKNLPVTMDMEHNSALSMNEKLHNFKIINHSSTNAGTYKISKNFLTYYPKKDFIGKDNSVVVQGHDKNNKTVNFDVNVIVNENKKPTAEPVVMYAMGNVPVTFSVTNGVTFSTAATVKKVEIVKNYNPKAGKLVIGPEATFTAANNFSGTVKYELKLTDTNDYTVIYPLTITVGK